MFSAALLGLSLLQAPPNAGRAADVPLAVPVGEPAPTVPPSFVPDVGSAIRFYAPEARPAIQHAFDTLVAAGTRRSPASTLAS